MLTPGVLLQNRYRILRQIGGGGMGIVYLAEDTRLAGRRCAIKEMSPAQLAPQDRTWAIPTFQQEAQMLANLKHHGLTPVTDFLPEGGNWYLVMDFVEGQTLEKRLQDAPAGRLPLSEALNVTRQLCDVLEYLHSQHPPVIFRDLKPGNVMLTSQGEVKLIDFGIARFFKAGQTRDTINLGTPGYAAPELFGGLGQSDPRSDVYSLGALLLHMATGYDPVLGVTPFPLPAPASLMPGLPPYVEEVISRATRVQPNLRHQSVVELHQALFPPTWQLPPQPLGTGVTPPPPGQHPTPKLGKRIGIGLGIAAVVMAGLCVVVLALTLPKILNTIGTYLPTLVQATEPLSATASLTGPPPTVPDAATPAVTPSTKPTLPLTPPADTDNPIPTLLRLAYVNGGVGDTDIYVTDASGSGRTCVACSSCDEAEPSWSPDGRYIVYQADCDYSYDIWTVSSSGGNPMQLTRTSGQDEREPDWSHDGSRIAYRVNVAGSDRNADGILWVMNADGSNAYRLGIWGRSPVWSPDGRRLAFMSEQTGGWEIYVYDFQAGTSNRVTDCSANCRWPDWSPDGRSVIYHSTTGPGSTDADTIWYVSASGGTPTQVVSGYHAGRPSWSTRGMIVFNSDQGIEIVREDGSQRRTVVSGDVNWAPEWSE